MSGEPTMEAVDEDLVEESAPDPAARVLSWRIEQLISVGFASDDALRARARPQRRPPRGQSARPPRLPAADGIPHPRLSVLRP